MAAGLTVVIPARAGSRGIPGKNLRSVGGLPMIQWAISACVEAQSVHRVLVSTDDPSIEALVAATFSGAAKVALHRRSAATATDRASTESVLIEYLQSAPEVTDFALVQATSPLLQGHDVDAAYAAYRAGGYDSLLTVSPQARFEWRRSPSGEGVPLNYDPRARPRRQEFEPRLIENGALYITSRTALLETGVRLSGRIGLHEMSAETYIEVDEPPDLAVVDALLSWRKRGMSVPSNPGAIRLVLTDVDGVLTDNGLLYGSDGCESKTFSARDGKGFQLLREAGVKTGFITSETGGHIEARAKKLDLDILIMGSRNKLNDALAVLERHGLSLDQLAYIGDDVHDLELLQAAGFSAAPADALPDILRSVDYVCSATGGHGAFRDVADKLLSPRSEFGDLSSNPRT